MPFIKVSKPRAMVDEIIDIQVGGLRPHQNVTLRAFLDELGKKFEAHAHFVADDNGDMNTRQISEGGSYVGIQRMGLFTSMKPSPNQKPGTRLCKIVSTTPFEVHLAVFDGWLTTEDFYMSSAPAVLSETKIERWYLSDDVERIKISTGNIRGVLFKPKNSNLCPGVIDIFGFIGGIFEFRAALLASHGYATLCLPYFKYEDLPISEHRVTMEYFEEAVDWMISLPFVAEGGLGVVGVSMGAQIGMMMSVLFQQKIKACVCINGWHYHVKFSPARLYKNEQKPVIIYDLTRTVFIDDKQDTRLCPVLGPYLEKDVVIEIEKATSSFLFVVGEDDRSIKSSELADQACQRLRDHEKENWTLISYPGAGHRIEPPYTPLCSEVYQGNGMGVWLFGGRTKEHAEAQEDAWRNILAFFHQHLRCDNNSVKCYGASDAGLLSKL